ncbi:MAG TPA: hypothetical protein VGO50_19500 [Pyrinomonadaceae bacterium]|nr:hypothetical protein [Pyrinomonadaceae bacterium]
MSHLIRYWIRFNFSEDQPRYKSYVGLKMGCGVTAYSLDDAVELMKGQIFNNDPFPEIKQVVENIDISSLDNHVLPNIGLVNYRGIWFPNIG